MGKLLQFPRRLTPEQKRILREKGLEFVDLLEKKFKLPVRQSPPPKTKETNG